MMVLTLARAGEQSHVTGSRVSHQERSRDGNLPNIVTQDCIPDPHKTGARTYQQVTTFGTLAPFQKPVVRGKRMTFRE